MKALRLLRVSITVSDIGRLQDFYTAALGFTPLGAPAPLAAAEADVLDAGPATGVRLQRGRQVLELAAFRDPGAAYPPASASNDLWFQHCALVTDDIGQAYARLSACWDAPISRLGPVTLPGGIVAYKFRDPDGHPLELIQFPQPNPATVGGIDHSAIAVADVAASERFYAGLGLSVAARQVNTGPAQDALDALDGAVVDVVALAPHQAAPHVELLGYRAPPGRSCPPMRANDVAASRLVFQADAVPGDAGAVLLHDPDGHAVLLTG